LGDEEEGELGEVKSDKETGRVRMRSERRIVLQNLEEGRKWKDNVQIDSREDFGRKRKFDIIRRGSGEYKKRNSWDEERSERSESSERRDRRESERNERGSRSHRRERDEERERKRERTERKRENSEREERREERRERKR
jgi:hypothetical protein